MKLIHIASCDKASHTIDSSLLTPLGWTLDAGAFGFCFTRALSDLNQRVIAVDPSRRAWVVNDPLIRNAYLLKVALAANSGLRTFHEDNDPLICKLSNDGLSSSSVYCMSIEDTMTHFQIQQFDCVKLDIEGAEYEVLLNWPGPIAKQISVEFHSVAARDFSVPSGLEMTAHIEKWYKKAYEAMHDTLYVLKDCC